MFDKVCAASPFFVRHFTRNGLVKGLQARCEGEGGEVVVTEQLMFDVCREVTPSEHLERTLQILEETRTTTDAH